MAGPRSDTREGARRFGPLDPFCLLVVGALVLLALLCLIGGLVLPAVVFVGIAVLLLPADKYWNRP